MANIPCMYGDIIRRASFGTDRELVLIRKENDAFKPYATYYLNKNHNNVYGGVHHSSRATADYVFSERVRQHDATIDYDYDKKVSGYDTVEL